MNNSVLLDTSFVISLVDDSRKNHTHAVDFYRYFIENKIHMILSAIVTSEFCIKQSIYDLPLNNFRLLPFNIPESHHLSNVFIDKFKSYNPDTTRSEIKDDYKIVSQCSFNNIKYLITEDSGLYKLVKDLQVNSSVKITPLFFPNGLNKEMEIPPTLFDNQTNDEK